MVDYSRSIFNIPIKTTQGEMSTILEMLKELNLLQNIKEYKYTVSSCYGDTCVDRFFATTDTQTIRLIHTSEGTILLVRDK